MRFILALIVLTSFFSCTYPVEYVYIEVEKEQSPEEAPIEEPVPESEPEEELPPPPVADEWALYVVDCLGFIVYEDHCNPWYPEYYYSREYYRERRRIAFQSEVEYGTGQNRPWRLVEGYIYEEPTE